MGLTAEDWKQVESLLPQALGVPEGEREAFLEFRCDNARVRAELRSLLDAASNGTEVMASVIGVATRGGESLPAGSEFGAWRVEQPIGRGGMGEVYAAARADGVFEMPAAIKILKRGLDTDAVVRRFLRERRILARLSHPNIAHLLDAGATPDGRPYLVMERVDGVRITDWCRDARLSIVDVLALFCVVCDAVDAAHRNLVVHRDLKPSNVLVTRAGQIKLLDFGIAKLLGEEDAETTHVAGEAMPMTPAYAAPEQIRGEPVTPATDVYALGAMLYELLTGQLPHQRKGSAIGGLLEQLKRETVERPSQVARRADRDRKVIRSLAGDLDLILLKALHADPQRRYRSAAELGADLTNYLAQRPVMARPDSAAYQLNRFVRRNRVAVAASAVVILAIVAGFAGFIVEGRRAQLEARKATAVRDFLIGIFEHNNVLHPDGPTARQTTALELMEIGVQRVRTALHEAPEVRAELLETFGAMYAGLDLPTETIALQREVLVELQRLHGSRPHRRVAIARSRLGVALTGAGEFEEAQRELSAAVDMFRVLGDGAVIEYPAALSTLGEVAYRTRSAADQTAEQRFREAVALLEVHHPRSQWHVQALASLARVADYREDYTLAETRYREALAKAGPDRFSEAAIRQELGDTLRKMNRLEEAEEHLRAAVRLQEQASGVDHPRTIDARRELGKLLTRTLRRIEALELLSAALASAERSRGPDDFGITLYIRFDLAGLLLERGALDDAARELGKAVTVAAAQDPGGNMHTAALGRLARAQILRGELDAAQANLRVYTERVLALSGPEHNNHAAALVSKGDLLLARGDVAGAKRQFEEITQRWPLTDGVPPWQRLGAHWGLARTHLAMSEPAVAVQVVEPVLAKLLALPKPGASPSDEATTQYLLGLALARVGAPDRASPHLQRALELRQQIDDARSPALADVKSALAAVQKKRGGT